MFYLAHFGDEVRGFDQFRMRAASGADDVHAFGALGQGFDDSVGIEHFVADDVIDFVKNDEVVFFAVNLLAAEFPGLLAQLDVFGVGLGTANLDEATAHGPDLEFIVTEHFGGVKFTVMPGAFDELHHHHAQTLAYGAKSGAQGAGRLPLSRPGINDQQSFSLRHRYFSFLTVRRIVSCVLRNVKLAVELFDESPEKPESGNEAIADTADGGQVFGLGGILFDVAAEADDEIINGAGVGVFVQAPDIFEDGLARDGIAVAADQMAQKLGFHQGELDGRAVGVKLEI